MSEKTFSDLKNEWVKGYEDHKADGEAALYVGATLLISVFTLFVLLGAVALGVAILKSIFWYVIGGVILYGLGAKFLGFPVPSFVKKFL